MYGACISFTLFLHQGVAIIHLRKMWEKLLLAARVIAAIENPADICVLSHRPYGQVSIGECVNIGHYCFLIIVARNFKTFLSANRQFVYLVHIGFLLLLKHSKH